MPTLGEIEQRFSYHKPNVDQAKIYEYIRANFKRLAHEINAVVPESREKSAAFTYLETAQFWFNAGVARNQEKVGDVIYLKQPTDQPPAA